MSSSDVKLRNKAMTYFIANHHTNGYASFDVFSTTKQFLPLQGTQRLVSPAECFTNEKCAVLGFNILLNELHIHANVRYENLHLSSTANLIRNLASLQTRPSQSALIDSSQNRLRTRAMLQSCLRTSLADSAKLGRITS
jgi:hypothetical protein